MDILKANHKVTGDHTGLSVAELQKMLDLVGTKMEAYMNQKDKAEAELKKMDDRIALLNKQLSEEQQKGYQPGGQLLVKLYSRESTASNITITYIVPNAGWSPTYDLWVDDVKSPVKFFYKANIYQNSGVKWNNVHLSLSTGNPQEGMQAPVLNPIYVAFYVPPPPAASYSNRGYVVTEYKKPLVDKYKHSATMQTTDLVAQQPGVYQRQRGAAINSDGGRGSGIYQSSMNQYVTVDNEGVNTTFDIDLPYTIPSDGQQHLVAVKRYEAPASYEYYAVPKMDKDAFLMARVTNWQDLNLLPGQTNIFYEGTYVGQGYIDTRNIKDTMSISLGRDKKIVISRERDKKLRSTKTIGTNVREEFAYNITVRNTRKEPITIVLQDQQPVSNDSELGIEDVNNGGAALEESTGIMQWSVPLKGNETKTLKFGYTLKYPKGKIVQ